MAKLKALYKSIDDIPEAYRELFEKTDDGYVFTGMEDSEFKKKLDEFRTTNVGLRESLEEIQEELKKLKDIDPEEHKKLLELKKALEANEETKLLADGKWEEVLERRTEGIRADLEGQIESLNKSLQDERTEKQKAIRELRTIHIDQDLAAALNAEKAPKPRPGAIADIKHRTHSVFRYDENGKRHAYGEDGKVRFGKDGKDWSMAEHIAELAQNAPHLFMPGKGGGATGSDDLPPGHTISRDDGDAITRNLEDIAAGKVTVK